METEAEDCTLREVDIKVAEEADNTVCSLVCSTTSINNKIINIWPVQIETTWHIRMFRGKGITFRTSKSYLIKFQL